MKKPTFAEEVKTILDDLTWELKEWQAGRLRYVQDEQTGEFVLRNWRKAKAKRAKCGAKTRAGGTGP